MTKERAQEIYELYQESSWDMSFHSWLDVEGYPEYMISEILYLVEER